MKLKKSLTKDMLDDIAGIIDNEGFGYMLVDSGLEECSPEFLLDSDNDIKKVNEAINTIKEYYRLLPSY